MSHHTKTLDQLLTEDAKAAQYFSSLPDYVQQSIRTRSQSVNSLASLQDYADNLLRGDD